MATNGQRSKIDVLLNLVPDSPSTVLAQLSNQPDLASKQDAHGYSLLHAASSYGHIDLLTTLVRTYNVSPNIVDEDNETPLFAAETVPVATALLELGSDINWKNAEGLIAEEKIEAEDEFPLVAAFLRQHASRNPAAAQQGADVTTTGSVEQDPAAVLARPPPLPEGLQVNIGTMQEPQEGEVDPEFRRRIEELAARDDFQGEEGQRQLRELVTEAVTGLREDTNERDVRRRIGD